MLTVTGFVFAQKQPLMVAVSLSNPTCTNTEDGRIQLIAQGGQPPYNYIWSNGETSAIVSNLTAGFYDVTISDQTTSITVTVEVKNPQPISINGNIINASSFGNNNGSIDVNIQGVEGSFDFTWTADNNNYVNTGTLDQSNLEAGTYTLTVTNQDGCSATTSFTVQQPNPVLNPFNGNTTPAVGHNLNHSEIAYPNPSEGRVNFKTDNFVHVIQVYSMEGILMQTINNKDGNFEAIDLNKGTYTAMIQLIDGTTTTQKIIVK